MHPCVMPVLLLAGMSARAAELPDVKVLPGRQVRVSAINIGFGGDREQKMPVAIKHLDVAGDNKAGKNATGYPQ